MPGARILMTDTATGDQRAVGEIRLEGGKVVATTPAVEHVARRPIYIEVDGRLIDIDPAKEPERFIEALPRFYNGSYMRAEALP